MSEHDELWDENRTADFLAMKAQSLTAARCRGTLGLPYIKVGRLVRYRKSDIEKWLAERTQTCTAGR